MKRTVEVFVAGCGVCTDVVDRVRSLAGPACEVRVLDMHHLATERHARSLGIVQVPAVVVNGKLVEADPVRGYDDVILLSTGIGADDRSAIDVRELGQ
jgi:glutaredoxin 3